MSNGAATGSKKIFGAIFKGSEYGKEIQDKLAEIDKVAQDLKDEADVLSKQTINKIHDGMTNNDEKLDSLSTDIMGRFDSMGNDMESQLKIHSVNLLNSVKRLLDSRPLPAELLSNPVMNLYMQHPVKPVASRKSMFTRCAHKPGAGSSAVAHV